MIDLIFMGFEFESEIQRKDFIDRYYYSIMMEKVCEGEISLNN